MIKSSKGDYELNFVYQPRNSDGYQSVHVVLVVSNKNIKINIYADNEMELVDIDKIVNGLEKEVLSKAGIDIHDDCALHLYMEGDEYYINIENEIKAYRLVYRAER